MGRIYAPSLADIKMGYDEIILEEALNKALSIEMVSFFFSHYKRYLDDIWFIWTFEWRDALEIIKHSLNSIDPKIKFVIDTASDGSLPYLDVRITIHQDGKVSTDIYSKPTDTFNYTPFNSCHPRHVIRNIPYCLARRVRGIVSNENVLPIRMGDLKKRLINKKYPHRIIDDAIRKAMSVSRQSIIDGSSKVDSTSKEKNIFFVSNFDPSTQHPSSYISSALSNFNNTRKAEHDILKINYSFRRAPSIKQLLAFRKSNCHVTPCLKGCTLCNSYLITGSEISLKSGHKLKTNANFQCSSRNLVYVAICGGCQEFYIGETGDQLKNRFTIHRQQSQAFASLVPVKADSHFRICGRGKYHVFPFHRPSKNTIIYRKAMEEKFIKLLKPKLNFLKLS